LEVVVSIKLGDIPKCAIGSKLLQYFHLLEVVGDGKSNPIIRFYILNIRMPFFSRWDDHAQGKEFFSPWHLFIDVLEPLTYPPGKDHISHQAEKRNIIDANMCF